MQTGTRPLGPNQEPSMWRLVLRGHILEQMLLKIFWWCVILLYFVYFRVLLFAKTTLK